MAPKDDHKHHPNGIRIGYQSSQYANGDNTSDENMDHGYIGFMRKMDERDLFHLETGLEYLVASANLGVLSWNRLTKVSFYHSGVMEICVAIFSKINC